MSQPNPTSIPCGRCEAVIGQACRTITGKRATYTHSARTQPLNEAWVAGYDDGLREGFYAPEYAARFVAANPE